MVIKGTRLKVLRAVVGRVIPADEFAGGVEAGVDGFIVGLLEGDSRKDLAAVEAGLDALEAGGFCEEDAAGQDEILRGLEGEAWFQRIVEMAMEGFYGDPANGANPGEVSWKMIGYDPGEGAEMSDGVELEPVDVVVVGAGAGGGVVACLAAEGGKRVLLLERGREYVRPWAEMPQDHLRNHRLAVYGHNTGPDLEGNPRVFVDHEGKEHVVGPIDGGYHPIAAAVGGGTLVYGVQAWRYKPADFQMASLYGVPAGSGLADWPITYEDMRRFYERAEWEIGVAGEEATLWGTTSPPEGGTPGGKGYPMPAAASNRQREILEAAGSRRGWVTHAVPLLINTAPYLGRPACVQCGNCPGFPCPSDGKNGTQNTMIPRARATGRCTLISQAMVEKILTDARGQANGVSFLVESAAGLVRKTVRAKIVVIAGGAIESARLLLNSRCDAHPRGLGNDFDQVGRNLQGHYYPFAYGLFDERHHSNAGPGVTVATTQFNHGNKGIIGGGMLANEFVRMPASFAKRCVPPEVPRWGLAHKKWMRENYTRILYVTGPVQEISNPEGRVTADAQVKDKYGIPVARLSGTTHGETVRAAEFMTGRALDWLKEAGAKKVWTSEVHLRLSGGQHQAGTCRMGRDAKTSVADERGRVHGQENLYVADGSLHVTNGGFNPVLTILALGFRVGEAVARK